MFLFYSPRILLAALLVSLAVSPCLTIPVGPATTRSQSPVPTGGPSTPGKTALTNVPPAPQKGHKKAPQEITEYVVDWMESKETSFRGMSPTQGGTEIWCQFDFEIATKLRQGIDVENEKITVREQPVYDNGRLKADWVFPHTNQHKGLIVELKVESKSQTQTDLVNKIVKDQKKVSGLLDDQYKDYDTAVLAILWNASTRKLLE